jgi:putative ABC transport system permease protein
MTEGLALTACGLGLGLGMALLLGPVLESSLHGVGGRDPMTYAMVGALLAGVAALASYLPARRAADVEAAAALRRE